MRKMLRLLRKMWSTPELKNLISHNLSIGCGDGWNELTLRSDVTVLPLPAAF